MNYPPELPPPCQKCIQKQCPAREAHLSFEHYPEHCPFFQSFSILENNPVYYNSGGTFEIGKEETEYSSMRKYAVGNDF